MSLNDMSNRVELKDGVKGSRKNPIRIGDNLDASDLKNIKDTNIYIEKEKIFSMEFWNKVYENNLAVFFIEEDK